MNKIFALLVLMVFLSGCGEPATPPFITAEIPHPITPTPLQLPSNCNKPTDCIAFQSTQNGWEELFLVGAQGGEPFRVSTATSSEGCIVSWGWWPDHEKLVYEYTTDNLYCGCGISPVNLVAMNTSLRRRLFTQRIKIFRRISNWQMVKTPIGFSSGILLT